MFANAYSPSRSVGSMDVVGNEKLRNGRLMEATSCGMVKKTAASAITMIARPDKIHQRLLPCRGVATFIGIAPPRRWRAAVIGGLLGSRKAIQRAGAAANAKLWLGIWASVQPPSAAKRRLCERAGLGHMRRRLGRRPNCRRAGRSGEQE